MKAEDRRRQCERITDALRSQRAAHRHEVDHLEELIAASEAEREVMWEAHGLVYKFFTKKRPDLAAEFVAFCKASGETPETISEAIDGIEDEL